MHTGRVTQIANLPAGGQVVGPTSEVCPGEMYTDASGMQPHSPPRAMTEADIKQAIAEYTQAARLAVDAGFDGIELHAANGYLIEQFLNANVNRRTDGYGGSIRLSPYGVFNATGPFPEVDAQYVALAAELARLGLLYLHVLDHSAMGSPPVPAEIKAKLRSGFSGLFILAGGFDGPSAERALVEQRADLIAFGRPFLANPDLPERLRVNAKLNAPDMDTFYVPGAKGYTDYPTLAEAVTS